MRYFVTGATGLIGRHLVTELLRRDDSVVHVLVRPGSRACLDRLAARWDADGRVLPVEGDLRSPGLGIERFAAPVDHLFHVAAAYHLEVEERTAWETNVAGTRRVVEFAERHEVGVFHHVSTNGVAGRHKGPFREDMLEEGQTIDHPYFRSKWQAERIVRSQLTRPLRVYRPGVVVGRADTGEMDKIDGAYYFFTPIRLLARLLPRWVPLVGPDGRAANIVPVDFCARAIDHIAHLPADALPGDTFHLLDNRITVGEAMNALAGVAGAPRLALRLSPRLTHPLARALRRLPGAEMVRSTLLARLGIPPQALDWRDFDAEFDVRNTERALAGSGIELPPLQTYVSRLYGYWEDVLLPEQRPKRGTDEALRLLGHVS